VIGNTSVKTERGRKPKGFEVINMTQVIIDHTGSCEGHSFVKNESVDLPDNVIGALGAHVISSEQKSASVVAKTVKKEAIAPKNRMIKRAKVTK
jgi:hypothetical protein